MTGAGYGEVRRKTHASARGLILRGIRDADPCDPHDGASRSCSLHDARYDGPPSPDTPRE